MRWLLVCALFPLLVACGPEQSQGFGDPGESDPTAPAARGDVVTRSLITVMDTGDGPEACLGAVAESYPPQCSGPAIRGWSWADHARYAEQEGRVQWGEFALRGAWDGTALTLAEAVPAALYDARPAEEPSLPPPSVDLAAAELERIAEELGRTVPGAQGAYPDGAGHVLVDVVFDDGSLQDWVNRTYGDGVVVVTSALVAA